jgi:ribose transport system ATP-binding protein
MSVSDSTPRLRVQALSKSFAGVQVLHEITFDAHAGEILGIVGENGSGKSSTMNILAGVIAPDAGRIALNGEAYAPAHRGLSEAAGVAFIQQELNIFPNLSVGENLFLGRYPRLIKTLPFISRKIMGERAKELLHAVDLTLDPSTPASRLSAAERQLLEIARGLSVDAQIMILDEPTSSLSARESERLFAILDTLRAQGVAILFVSHSLSDVLRLSDRLLVLRDGRVVLTASRGQVQADDLIKAMVGRSLEAQFPRRATPRPMASTTPALRVEHVSEPGMVADVTFEVGKGEIVGIAGLMGSGRTELARIIFGLEGHREGCVYSDERKLPAGDVRAALDSGMAFLTEDRRHEGLMLEASVAENVALAALPIYSRPGTGRICLDVLNTCVADTVKSLGVKCPDIDHARVGTLSGGHQQKVVLARWLLRKPSLFILDEPTRGVDVGAKADIYRLMAGMADRGAGMLVISSELDELIGLCDRILVMRAGRLRATFERAQFSVEAILRAAFGQGLTG